jgi:hypothetical protein
MQRLKLIMLCLVVLYTVGCTPSWKRDTVAGYEIGSVTLSEIGTTAKAMCETGSIKQADCDKIKDVYNKARKAYITAGDALKIAIKTDDAIKKKEATELYKTATNDFVRFIGDLIKLAGELGITSPK